MGIYDREYYRGEPRSTNWLSGPGPVCRWIILINVAAFFATFFQFIPPSIVNGYLAASSDGIFREGRVWELLTATFLHDDLLHILLNMWLLWIIGRELEAMYGSLDFLIFYLLAAVISTFGWSVCHFQDQQDVMVGASGAIFAALVVYTLFYPRREVIYAFIIPIQMWVLVSVILVFNALMVLKGGEWGVAGESHLTGAAFGYLYKHFDLRWSRLRWTRARRPTLRVITPEPREKSVVRPAAGPTTWSANPASVAKPSVLVSEDLLEARLDEVLAKIASEGRGGLTEEENRILQEASLRARNKRSEQL